MTEIIIRMPCQGRDCNDNDLKSWVCGSCDNGNIFLSENGIVKCNKCDYRIDYLSVDFCCKKCKEKKNYSIPINGKIKFLLRILDSEGVSEDFIENVMDSIMSQRRKYL